MFLGDIGFSILTAVLGAVFSGPILAFWGGLIGIPFAFLNQSLGL